MLKMIRNFRRDEDGAVTVDFVVLCAAVVALAIGVGAVIQGQVQTAAETIGETMTTAMEKAPDLPE